MKPRNLDEWEVRDSFLGTMDVHDQGNAALSSVFGLREVKIQTLPNMTLGTVLDVLDNFCIFWRDELRRSKLAEA